MISNFMRGFGFAMRETAYHADRIGCMMMGTHTHKERVVSWKRLTPFQGRNPMVESTCFVAPNANIIGGVHVAHNSNVFYQTVIRGDIRDVHIAGTTTIQDRCVIRCTPASECTIGAHVTIEPCVTITGCSIADDVYIGAGSVIMEGARIESQSIIAPGSVVQKFAVVPSGELWAGCPAEKIRDLTDEEVASLRQSALHAAGLAEAHKDATEKSFYQEDEEVQVLEQWTRLEAQREPIRMPYGQFDAGPIGSGTHLNIPGQVMAGKKRVI